MVFARVREFKPAQFANVHEEPFRSRHREREVRGLDQHVQASSGVSARRPGSTARVFIVAPSCGVVQALLQRGAAGAASSFDVPFDLDVDVAGTWAFDEMRCEVATDGSHLEDLTARFERSGADAVFILAQVDGGELRQGTYKQGTYMKVVGRFADYATRLGCEVRWSGEIKADTSHPQRLTVAARWRRMLCWLKKPGSGDANCR